MEIRQAYEIEFDAVMAFYYDLIQEMADKPYHPGWERDIYPTRDFIRESICTESLYIALVGEKIAGAMVLNNSCNDGYNHAPWFTNVTAEEVSVIHILGVSYSFQGQGVAKKLVAHAIQAAREKGHKSLRLDVLATNCPALKLYPAVGFVYVDTVQMFYEDTGYTDFTLFELLL